MIMINEEGVFNTFITVTLIWALQNMVYDKQWPRSTQTLINA